MARHADAPRGNSFPDDRAAAAGMIEASLNVAF